MFKKRRTKENIIEILEELQQIVRQKASSARESKRYRYSLEELLEDALTIVKDKEI
jgi:hypothetical protein